MLLFVFDVPLPWGMETLINTAAVIMAGGVFMLWKFQSNLIYMASLPHGSRTVVARPDQMRMPDFEDLTLTTPDGVKIRAYAIRNSMSRNPEVDAAMEGMRGWISNTTLLYLHANAGNMGHRLPIAHVFYHKLRCNVFMLSYRGYGLSEGEPSEKGIKIDAQTALDWITNHPQFGKTKVVVYGQSIGGAVAIDLVHKNPTKVAALIRKLIPHVMPVAAYFTFLCHQVWDSEVAITKIPSTIPILLLSGKKDELIPQKQMIKLTEAAKTARGVSLKSKEEDAKGVRWVEFANGMHNDTCVQEGYFEKIEEFWREEVTAKL
ncbi:Alpha/Beta hydrolase protein [Chytridium lagenaria]|nr:Alpha/Beta hydrolase protein [Chytridium lagenaria]